MMLTVGVNSYMSLEEADTIIENELLDSDEEYTIWNSLNNKNKEKLIVRGTRTVDVIPFRGVKYNISKVGELQWPRLINNELIECPDDIKLGLLIQVLRDYKYKDRQETTLLELGVTNYKIKDASISLDPSKINKLGNGVYNDIFDLYFRKWVV